MKHLLCGVGALAVLLCAVGTSSAQPEPVPDMPPRIPPIKNVVPKIPDLNLKVKLPIPKIHHYHVKYRCLELRRRCFKDALQAKLFMSKLQGLGFQTKMVQQAGQYCIYYRLPVWKEKIFFGPAGHAQAHALEAFLKGLGCQTIFVHH